MAAFTKFNSFIERVFEGEILCASHSFKVAFSNTLPLVTNNNFADITEIAAGNGYTAGGHASSVLSSAQTAGIYKLVLSDVAIVASGSIGPFQYVIVYDDTHANDALVAFADYVTPITLINGQIFVVDLDQTNGLLQAS